MKKALLLGQVDAVGELLHQAWEHKKRLDASPSAARAVSRVQRPRSNCA